MKILNVKGIEVISKTTQKSINGGENHHDSPQYICAKLWCELPGGQLAICKDCLNPVFQP